MKTKEDILTSYGKAYEYHHSTQVCPLKAAHDAMDEFAKEKSIAFQEWLAEMTTIIKEEKITLYRYCERDNQCANYTLEDIYLEFEEHLKMTS